MNIGSTTDCVCYDLQALAVGNLMKVRSNKHFTFEQGKIYTELEGSYPYELAMAYNTKGNTWELLILKEDTIVSTMKLCECPYCKRRL